MTSTAFDVEIIRAGRGEERPVVFLHGLGRVTAADPVVEALAVSGPVVAPVAPGFNDPAELDAVRDVRDLALHYDDLLDDLGIDGATVVGHSLGGMIAAELAAHAPGRVARLVLAAPMGLWRDDLPAADVFAQPSALHRDALLWSDPARATATTGSADIDALLAVTQGLAAAGAFLWPLPDKGLSRRLRRIRARTLVVWGRDDRVVPPAYAHDLVSGIPGARMTEIDGSHMAPYEDPEAFATLVRRFLDADEAGA